MKHLLQTLFFQPKSVAWVLVHTEDPLGEDYHIKEPGSSWQVEVKRWGSRVFGKEVLSFVGIVIEI